MSVKRFDMHGEMHVNGKYADGEVAQELYDALEQMKSFMAWRYGDDDQFVMIANSAMARARGEK